jgi:Holliday junction resolvasome RuvABC endonuclease subunit
VSLKDIVQKEKWNKVLAIDPASHSLAWAILSWDKELIATGKIDLSKEKHQSEKFNKIKKELLEEVLEHHYKIDRRFVKIIEYPKIKHY